LADSLDRASLAGQKDDKTKASPTDTQKWFMMCKQHLEKATASILTHCEDEAQR
jgi:hypothetical protein